MKYIKSIVMLETSPRHAFTVGVANITSMLEEYAQVPRMSVDGDQGDWYHLGYSVFAGPTELVAMVPLRSVAYILYGEE